MSPKKKSDPVAETVKELTPEQIAALEADRAQLVAMVAAGSFTKPDAAAGHVNPFVDEGPVPTVPVEPVTVEPSSGSVPVEPAPVIEPSAEQQQELSALIQTRAQARDELRVMEAVRDNMSEASIVVLGEAVDLLKGKISAKLAELQALDGQISTIQKSMAPSAGGLVGELDHDVEATAQSEQAQQKVRSEAQAKRLGEAIEVARAEYAALVALDKAQGQHLDALAVYHDDPRRIPVHYDRATLKHYVLVPAFETRQTLRQQIAQFQNVAIPEARALVTLGWRPGREHALAVEDAILALTRPEGLARTLSDQIATFTGHLKRLSSAAKLRKQAIASGQAEPPVLIHPQPVIGKSKPVQDPSVEKAETSWNPFK